MKTENGTIINSIRTLHDLSKAINSTLDSSQVEDMLLHKTAQLMEADEVLILLLDKDKHTLIIHNALGLDIAALPMDRFQNIQPFDHCIVHKGSVITLREVLSTKDTRLIERSYPKLLEMLFAPLEIMGEAYGLLGISGREEPFSRINIEIFCSIGSQAAVAMENAALYKRLRSTFLHTAEALAEAVNSRDPYTGGHTQRVQQYVLQLATALDFPAPDKEPLRLAAILHDIGKIGIDDAILRKVGKLTPAEKKEMGEHPAIGARILNHAEGMAEVIPGVLHHHEWFDGSGYPDQLKGEQIPLQARIIAIADAFDALTTDRPYRSASTAKEALAILQQDSGSHFDPELLAVFRFLQTSAHG